MRMFLVVSLVLAAVLSPVRSQGVPLQDDRGAKQDMKDAGKSMGRATKKTAH